MTTEKKKVKERKQTFSQPNQSPYRSGSGARLFHFLVSIPHLSKSFPVERKKSAANEESP